MDKKLIQMLIDEIRENRAAIKEVRSDISGMDKIIFTNKIKLTGLIAFISIVINVALIKIKSKLGVM